MKKSLSLQELYANLNSLIKTYIPKGYEFYYTSSEDIRIMSIDGIEISKRDISFLTGKIKIPMQMGCSLYVLDTGRSNMYSVFSGNKSEKYTMNVFPREEMLIYIPDQAKEIVRGMIYTPYSPLEPLNSIWTLVEVKKTKDQVFVKKATVESICQGNPIYREAIYNPEDYISGYYKIIL